MGWLQRLFGLQKKPKTVSKVLTTTQIPPEKVGLDGKFDRSGLAKRVAAAFDNDPSINDIHTIYVSQLGSTVILKGKVLNQAILNKIVNVAKGVSGAKAVDSSQVDVG